MCSSEIDSPTVCNSVPAMRQMLAARVLLPPFDLVSLIRLHVSTLGKSGWPATPANKTVFRSARNPSPGTLAPETGRSRSLDHNWSLADVVTWTRGSF